MKGIILAGGEGTRLKPLTGSISKQILPVFDKPMIYYPLSTLISMGINEILIITNPHNISIFQNLLGDGSQWGLDLRYEVQKEANGIAEALIISERFINRDNVALILGDNIFFSSELNNKVAKNFSHGARIFIKDVKDPERYGVVKFQNNQPTSIIEKPKNFISSKAVTGLYFYDDKSVDLAKNLEPSQRGELEISDLNNVYLSNRALDVLDLGQNSIWLDAGTFASLKDSSEQIAAQQNRSGQLMGSPELESFKQGFFDRDKIIEYLDQSPVNDYYQLLKENTFLF